MDSNAEYLFGPFRLAPARRELIDQAGPVTIGNRAFDLLLALASRQGGLVTKNELMEAVWPGTIVAENNLTTQIATLRRALREGTGDSRYILSVAGRGYRFVAPITLAGPPVAPTLARAPAPPAPDGMPHNLPVELSSFIGRDEELAEIARHLPARAVVTLAGAGGIGKTRLALRAAAEARAGFADGCWYVELAPLTDPTLVAEAICRTLGVPIAENAEPVGVATAFLRRKQALLVLDNCEHVIEGAATLASAISRACPGVRILATSREPLAVPGEYVLRLPPLALPPADGPPTAAATLRFDAMRLLVQRAADTLGQYTLTDEDAPAFAAICRRLDGLPLATELAAARLRLLKPAEIAARLEDVFRVLGGANRGGLPRQQTLRATIAWSHDLLSPQEQMVLRRLAVFVDGMSLDGAIAVAAGVAVPADDVLDLLASLIDKSLLVVDRAAAATRYRMLETTRQFAAEKLEASGEAHEARARLATYLHELYAEAELLWPVTRTDAWLERFAPEAETLRAAIAWAFRTQASAAEAAQGVALVAVAGCLADELSLKTDLRRWTTAAMPRLTETTPLGVSAWVIFHHSWAETVFGVAEIPPLRALAIQRFRAAGDEVGLARALRQAAIAIATPGGSNEPAMAMLREAETLMRRRGPTKDLATTLAHTGTVHWFIGDAALCRRCNEEALAMREALGDRAGQLASYQNMAEFRFLDGDIEGAIGFAEQAVAMARRWNKLATKAVLLGNIAGYRLARDEITVARTLAREALGINRALGQDDYAIPCLEHLALAAALRGEAARAARIAGHTDAYYRRTGQLRDRLEQVGYDRLTRTLDQAIGASERLKLMEESAFWSADTADAAALAEPTEPPPQPDNDFESGIELVAKSEIM